MVQHGNPPGWEPAYLDRGMFAAVWSTRAAGDGVDVAAGTLPTWLAAAATVSQSRVRRVRTPLSEVVRLTLRKTKRVAAATASSKSTSARQVSQRRDRRRGAGD
jgi:hypothetical protein